MSYQLRWMVLAAMMVFSGVGPLSAAVSYTVTKLATFGGKAWHEGMAWGINNCGQVVGKADSAASYGRAFLYSGGLMTDLGTLGGQHGGAAKGINDTGQVVGEAETTQGPDHAFLYSDGVMTDLGTLGGSSSDALAINASGQVVGIASIAGSSNYWHAFLYSEGSMHDLGTLRDGDYSDAFDINASGQVVGFSDTTGDHEHAFLYDRGTMTDLGTLGGTSSHAYAINNDGQIVGDATNASGAVHAVLWSGGVMQELVGPDGPWSYAYDVNNSGKAVGSAHFAAGYHAVLYNDGVIIDLNSLIPSNSGWILDTARAINDAGQIVGYGSVSGYGDFQAFLLAPVPEPSTFVLLGIGAMSNWLGFAAAEADVVRTYPATRILRQRT